MSMTEKTMLDLKGTESRSQSPVHTVSEGPGSTGDPKRLSERLPQGSCRMSYGDSNLLKCITTFVKGAERSKENDRWSLDLYHDLQSTRDLVESTLKNDPANRIKVPVRTPVTTTVAKGTPEAFSYTVFPMNDTRDLTAKDMIPCITFLTRSGKEKRLNEDGAAAFLELSQLLQGFPNGDSQEDHTFKIVTEAIRDEKTRGLLRGVFRTMATADETVLDVEVMAGIWCSMFFSPDNCRRKRAPSSGGYRLHMIKDAITDYRSTKASTGLSDFFEASGSYQEKPTTWEELLARCGDDLKKILEKRFADAVTREAADQADDSQQTDELHSNN